MALQLTLSCDLDKSQSGPTLIHSTGVQDYKIPPEVVGEDEVFDDRKPSFVDSKSARKYLQ